ncbi:indole-3-glycerol phosphate synthase TrpC [Neobacillus piezotolerans]|uniref:Indole-3-glycerol phosphate synthase n=1 Tax=Neobacillus piezotolerans TaxID=2259171 RepID=A0A3D8GPW9_9BACI|nr:indole-3-glycerol phosphate synthase TrpC [Neobacillus piezotolerans]RDU36478.1 indole-3-glycerol phosphate synthase TrpC [Neobacillus piezotolerans]
METILDRILAEKQKEVAYLKEYGMEARGSLPKRKPFIEVLKHSNDLAIIAEFKRASPSRGLISENIRPGNQAKLYEQAGASAISVLTDSAFFKGSFDDLREVRRAVGLPILCKDFIIDEIQIDHAYLAGADIILLIVAALEESRLMNLHTYAKSLGLEVLVEIHNEEEFVKATNAGAELIGINNRDLRTFTISLETTTSLGPMVRASGACLISESGMKSASDAKLAAAAGAQGLLIGQTFMESGSMKESFRSFIVPKLGVALG